MGMTKAPSTMTRALPVMAKKQNSVMNTVLGQPNMAGPAAVTVAGSQPISTQFNSGAPIDRSQVRDIQGVDELGSATSGFMQNMMQQYSPMFQQQRAENMAAAREGAGTMTGSGFANRLGMAMNRSLGQEQATIADLARSGMGMELQRQQANQGADMGFMNNLLTQNSQNLQAQGMASNAEQFNSSQQWNRNSLQANLDAQRNNLGWSTNQQTKMDQQRLQLERDRLAAEQKARGGGGWKGAAGNILGGIVGSVGGPIGTAIGSKIGGFVGGLFK